MHVERLKGKTTLKLVIVGRKESAGKELQVPQLRSNKARYGTSSRAFQA